MWLPQEHEDKPEDCIPAEPGNEDARNFLANAPTRGLWMPLGKEVKVMQCEYRTVPGRWKYGVSHTRPGGCNHSDKQHRYHHIFYENGAWVHYWRILPAPHAQGWRSNFIAAIWWEYVKVIQVNLSCKVNLGSTGLVTIVNEELIIGIEWIACIYLFGTLFGKLHRTYLSTDILNSFFLREKLYTPSWWNLGSRIKSLPINWWFMN